MIIFETILNISKIYCRPIEKYSLFMKSFEINYSHLGLTFSLFHWFLKHKFLGVTVTS